jgi:hypothetical protein
MNARRRALSVRAVRSGPLSTRRRMSKGRVVVLAALAAAVVAAVGASAASSVSAYVDTILADSPTGYWRLGEDVNATTAADASGHGHAGAYGARVTPGTAGAIGSDPDTAAQFPGASTGSSPGSDLRAPTASDLNFGTTDFTAEAWIRPGFTVTPSTQSAQGGESAILAKASGLQRFCNNPSKVPPTQPRDISWPGWSLTVTDDSGYEGRVRASIAFAQTVDDLGCAKLQYLFAYGPDVRVDDGRWHYVAAVISRASGVTIYVDGVPATTSRTFTQSIANNAALSIGSVNGAFPFQGDLDEPAVYGHALSSARIEAHREAGLALPPNAPVTPASDGSDTPGIVQTGDAASAWQLSNTLDSQVVHTFSSFCCGQALTGDWDGDGVDSGALFDNGHWQFNDGYDAYPDLTLDLGQAGDVPVVGDWNGDGIDTPGYRRGTSWYLSGGFGGTVDYTVDFGGPSDTPVVGDWNGDGKDTIGVFHDGTWTLSDTLDGTVSATVAFGQSGDTPLAGDWNNDGHDTLGVRRASTWYLGDSLSGSTDHQFDFGSPSDTPVAGDWDNDAFDTTDNVDDTPQARVVQHAAATPPALVTSLAPLVYLNEETSGSDWYNPAPAGRFWIKHADLQWMHPDQPDSLIRGRGRVHPYLLGRASDREAYAWGTNENSMHLPQYFYAWLFTRPYDTSHNRYGLVENAGFFLNIPPGQSVRNGLRDADQVPVYYDYKPGRWIRYWFFYAYDIGGAGFNHEGDWEGVTVHLNGSTPTEIRLDRHKSDCGAVYPWSDMQFESGHVVVYAAQKDHGTYKDAGRDSSPKCHPFIDDIRAATTPWHTWQRLGNVRKQDWYGFGGAWGEPGTRGETTGPLGPSQWKNVIPDGW